MKVVIQRSKESKVVVKNEVVGKISKGLVILVCFEKNDKEEVMEKAIQKILKLRCFEDEKGKMNLNLSQVGGEVLCISQFTLSWDGTGGNRPGFDNSMDPNKASEFYELFCEKLNKDAKVEKGVFGEEMEVFIQNSGPVTFNLSF